MTEPMPVCDRGCGDRGALFHFSFPAEIGAIAPVVEAISELARQELGTEKELELALALQEALANAVVHGSGNDPNKKVDCWAARGESGILIVVRDSGPGFDPDSIPDPLSQQHLGSDHGRGIHMIRRLMDDVHFLRNGAEIHMRKK